MENTMKFYVTSAGVYLGGWETDPPAGSIEVPYAPDHAGQKWDGKKWGAVPLPVPASITRRQCARELFNRKMITGPEMVAMTATGAPPAMIEEMFALMPDDEQWVARSDFAADTYLRDNPLLVLIMAASGSTPADIDQFFRMAAER